MAEIETSTVQCGREHMAPDRRRAGHDRLPVRIPVMVERKSPSGEVPIAGETENLSRGGVLLSVGWTARLGTALRVALRPRGPVALILSGTVVWTRRDANPPGWKQGLQFAEELSETLVGHLAEHAFPPREGASGFP